MSGEKLNVLQSSGPRKRVDILPCGLSEAVICNGVWPRTTSGDSFEVVDFQAYVNGSQLVVNEHPDYLNYVTPKFTVSSFVRTPVLRLGEFWVVGFIQACSHMRFFNTYASGFTSWEFPQLVFGEQVVISDSDGVNTPWYGCSSNEMITCFSPLHRPALHRIRLEDHFFPRISWTVPIGSGHNTDYLLRSERYQGFYTWLTAFDVLSNAFYPLRAVYWEMANVINIDPMKPPGQRATVLPKVASQPFVFDVNNMPGLTRDALLAPCANEAQTLIYRSFNDKAISIVCPPSAGRYCLQNNNNFEDFSKRLVATHSRVIAQYRNPVQPYREIPLVPTKPSAVVLDYTQRHRHWFRDLFSFNSAFLRRRKQHSGGISVTAVATSPPLCTSSESTSQKRARR